MEISIDNLNLRPDEVAVLKLRGLFEAHGYKKHRVNRFEEYSLYLEHKNFLSSDNIITFTDLDGRLLALKPDVTPSIIKNASRDITENQRLYYIEKVYRESRETRMFKEIEQMGLEHFGKIDNSVIAEVLSLAQESLAAISDDYVLAIGHIDHYDVNKLDKLVEDLEHSGFSGRVILDSELTADPEYYNGIIFKGYIKGVPYPVLSGGQYDNMMKKFGKSAGAIGFALNLSEFGGLDNKKEIPEKANDTLTVALPKGRLGDNVYKLFESIGYDCKEIYNDNRKLVFENEDKGVRFLLVKPSDVTIYVEHGAADIGVVGKDILLDGKPNVYDLVDLPNLGKCRMCVAAKNGYKEDAGRVLRVATKFVNIAKDYYANKNREIDIIKLNGSVELAPLLGMSDVIVDIVESGKTLDENNLSVIEEIYSIHAKLIGNISTYNFKPEVIDNIVENILAKLKEKANG